MSRLADDLCAEIRNQCEQAEHFKGLWLQSNNELESAKQRIEELNTLLAQSREEGRKEATAKLKHVCNLWIDPDTDEIIVDRCDHEPSECTSAYITEWVKP